MKKIALLLTLVLTSGILSACGQKQEELIMATESGFAPYEYTEDGTTVYGVDVDIANEIAKAMNKKLVIKDMDFDGALLAVQQGKVDFAAAGISVTDERKEKMDFSVEYAVSKQVILVNKSNTTIKSGDDLKGNVKIGVQQGTTADYYVQDNLKDADLKQFTKLLQASLDLKNNKLDCIIMDSLPAQELVKSNTDIKILDGELFTDKYAIAVKKGNTEMLNKINEVLNKLIAEGKIDEYTINHTK